MDKICDNCNTKIETSTETTCPYTYGGKVHWAWTCDKWTPNEEYQKQTNANQ